MKYVRILSIVLLLIVGINAMYAGLSFMIHPSGSGLGLTVDYIAHTPFKNYFIPGAILFICNGLFAIITVLFILRRKKYAPFFIIDQGIILTGWIVIQVWLVKDLNALHVLKFFFGITIIILGITWLRQHEQMIKK